MKFFTKKPKTVEQATAGLGEIITAMEEIEEASKNSIADTTSRMLELQQSAEAARSEASRARAIRSKIEALIS